ncbi:MAG TPA: alpha/beta fold hydrolase [Burkholderiaceae bacterium]|nr:alpha/beta fold hydrolase [Burkholderiaceae bacterium]
MDRRPGGDPAFALREWEGGDGPTLLCVHGMLGSARSWDPNVVGLQRVARVAAVDLWGHGASPAPADEARYAIGAMVDELDRARDRLGLERAMLCGHSFGAGLVLRYALSHPRRCAGVVFSNSMSALSPPELFGTSRARAERAAEIECGGLDAIRAMPMHPRHATRLPPGIREQVLADADRVDAAAVARLMRVTGPGLSVLDDLERIECPVLLINGRWERGFQPLREIALARMPRCRVADVEAGHAVNLENPAAFDAAVAAFVTEVVGAS